MLLYGRAYLYSFASYMFFLITVSNPDACGNRIFLLLLTISFHCPQVRSLPRNRLDWHCARLPVLYSAFLDKTTKGCDVDNFYIFLIQPLMSQL